MKLGGRCTAGRCRRPNVLRWRGSSWRRQWGRWRSSRRIDLKSPRMRPSRLFSWRRAVCDFFYPTHYDVIAVGSFFAEPLNRLLQANRPVLINALVVPDHLPAPSPCEVLVVMHFLVAIVSIAERGTCSTWEGQWKAFEVLRKGGVQKRVELGILRRRRQWQRWQRNWCIAGSCGCSCDDSADSQKVRFVDQEGRLTLWSTPKARDTTSAAERDSY